MDKQRQIDGQRAQNDNECMIHSILLPPAGRRKLIGTIIT